MSLQSVIDQIFINLEHDIDEQYQYQPGQVLRGTFIMVLKDTASVQTILLTFQGQGVVAWDDEDHGSYQANEEYMNEKKVLHTSANQRNFERGQHKFDFEYQLPDNLPSSFIGKYGNTAYMIKATVKGFKPNEQCLTSEPFLVSRYSPLPKNSCDAIIMEKQKRMGNGCSFGKLKIGVQLNCSGANPGDDVFVDAEIRNYSPRAVTAVQAALIMRSTYHAQSKCIEFRQIIHKRRDECEIDKNEGHKWTSVRLSIPPYLPETQLEHCDVIEITYMFQFKVELTGGKDFRMEHPFTIGTKQKLLDFPNNNDNQSKEHKEKTVNPERTAGSFVDDTKTWSRGVPEMRSEMLVQNPLFMDVGHQKGQAPEKPVKLSDVKIDSKTKP